MSVFPLVFAQHDHLYLATTDAVFLILTPPWGGLKTELSSQSTKWFLERFS